jgi:uncharacterized protein (DUF1800 family)
VLGRTGNLGGEDVCALALAQPACGRFLARKLLAFFAEPSPPAAIADAFGDLLRDGGYDIAAALETLFASRYFFDPGRRRALVKSPVEYVVGAARVFGVRLDAAQALPALRAMGQDLLAPPNVKGWPGGESWINTTTWLNRVNAARALVAGAQSGLTIARADRLAHAYCGTALPGSERARVEKDGAAGDALAHAVLSLPEAHLA